VVSGMDTDTLFTTPPRSRFEGLSLVWLLVRVMFHFYEGCPYICPYIIEVEVIFSINILVS
jgi:hypothetical protein